MRSSDGEGRSIRSDARYPALRGEWEVPVTRNAKITPVNEGGGGGGRGASPPGSPLAGSPVTRNAEIGCPETAQAASGMEASSQKGIEPGQGGGRLMGLDGRLAPPIPGRPIVRKPRPSPAAGFSFWARSRNCGGEVECTEGVGACAAPGHWADAKRARSSRRLYDCIVEGMNVAPGKNDLAPGGEASYRAPSSLAAVYRSMPLSVQSRKQ